MKTVHLKASLIIGLLMSFPVSAAVTDNVVVPVSQDVFVPCADGGAGELLTISGRMHVLFTWTADSAVGEHFTVHLQPMG